MKLQFTSSVTGATVNVEAAEPHDQQPEYGLTVQLSVHSQLVTAKDLKEIAKALKGLAKDLNTFNKSCEEAGTEGVFE